MDEVARIDSHESILFLLANLSATKNPLRSGICKPIFLGIHVLHPRFFRIWWFWPFPGFSVISANPALTALASSCPKRLRRFRDSCRFRESHRVLGARLRGTRLGFLDIPPKSTREGASSLLGLSSPLP